MTSKHRYHTRMWQVVDQIDDGAFVVALMIYERPIVERWRVYASWRLMVASAPGTRKFYINTFHSTYKTEAKARRAFADKHRHLVIRAAALLLGVEP